MNSFIILVIHPKKKVLQHLTGIFFPRQVSEIWPLRSPWPGAREPDVIPRESFADRKSRDLEAAILLSVVTQEGMPVFFLLTKVGSLVFFFFCCDLFVMMFFSVFSQLSSTI